MTAAELILWRKVQRRAAQLDPELASAILRSFQRVRDAMTESEIVRALSLGGADRLFNEILTQAVLDVAFSPVRDRLRYGIAEATKYAARSVPVPPGSDVKISFDFLNPRILDGVRILETRVLTDLQSNVRETVRNLTTQGLIAGVNPRETARSIRSVVGLGPAQLEQVRNYRDALLGKNNRTESDYTLRVKRYGLGKERTPEQIDRMVEAYTKRRIAVNAETIARTAALDAQKLGQRLSWEDAISQGVVDRDRLVRTWVGVMDDRERPEHRAMEGDTVPFDQPHSNGQMIPGEDEYNCRCIERYSLA